MAEVANPIRNQGDVDTFKEAYVAGRRGVETHLFWDLLKQDGYDCW